MVLTPRRKIVTLLCARRVLGNHKHIGLKIWQRVEWLETHYPLDVLRSCCVERRVKYDFTHMWHIFTEGALLFSLYRTEFMYDKRYRPVPHLKITKKC